ncbi:MULTISPECIES: hypothetical protein [unclassified Streptomyces]|uniref:hypothetical protein n=1 Tax=unclassified Streptomyces TaxID=2593676 RepID=UPI00352CD041
MQEQRRKRVGTLGDPTASAAAVLEIVDADEPPLRCFFGSGPLGIAKAGRVSGPGSALRELRHGLPLLPTRETLLVGPGRRAGWCIPHLENGRSTTESAQPVANPPGSIRVTLMPNGATEP